jgi:hypothetical protein
VIKSLKKLFVKWTTAVATIASEIGKNIAKAGRRIVPKPKPVKNVKTEAKKETTPRTNVSI